MTQEDRSYEFFLDTINYLNLKHIDLPDKDLENILEELEGDAYTFLHEDTLNHLIEKGLIPSFIKNSILTLRTRINNVPSEKWNTNEFRFNPEWKEIRDLATLIQKSIK